MILAHEEFQNCDGTHITRIRQQANARQTESTHRSIPGFSISRRQSPCSYILARNKTRRSLQSTFLGQRRKGKCVSSAFPRMLRAQWPPQWLHSLAHQVTDILRCKLRQAHTYSPFHSVRNAQEISASKHFANSQGVLNTEKRGGITKGSLQSQPWSSSRFLCATTPRSYEGLHELLRRTGIQKKWRVTRLRRDQNKVNARSTVDPSWQKLYMGLDDFSFYLQWSSQSIQKSCVLSMS